VRARRVPLRTRLLILAAAGMVPLAIVCGVGLAVLVHQQRQLTERAGIELTRALSIAVDAELQRSISVLQVLGSAPALERGELDRFYHVVRSVMQQNPSWLTVILAEPSGRPLVNARFELGAKLPAIVEPESFAAAVSSQRPVVGALAKGAGPGGFAVPVRVPVVRDGVVRYVLTAAVKPDGVVEIVSRQRVPPEWVVSVFDRKSMRVARSRQHAEYVGVPPGPSLQALLAKATVEGAGITTVLEGGAVYTAYSRSRDTGWTVTIGVPTSLVDAGTRRSLLVFGSGLALSLILAAIAGLLVARSIARPMDELRAAALALGRREPLELPETSIAEISQVAKSIAVAADERTRGEAEREDLLRREQQARAIAEEANRSKDEFLAMLGHELRNPLGAISNASQLLRIGDAEAQAHARGVIGRQVQHLVRMMDDLLDAARAMTGKIVLQRQPLELGQAAMHALSAVRTGGRSGHRQLVHRLSPVWVDADPTRVEQILGNLLGNALKFTPDDGVITVEIARDGDDAVLRVSDNGIGMKPELAARVFEAFVQGERPLDRSQGGLGIGLTLVKRLAELHGGSVIAASEGPGDGSAFTVRLPAIEPPSMSRAPSTPASVRARDVLIVEDNEDARETLRRMLELDGHRVRVAADGVAGLEAMRAAVPEIALIDVGLPRMDGYELARRIRRDIGGERRPYLVAVTGYGLPEDRARTREAGFDLHLVKPVEMAELDDVLAKR
jgi:signal transduction histidine kinase